MKFSNVCQISELRQAAKIITPVYSTTILGKDGNGKLFGRVTAEYNGQMYNHYCSIARTLHFVHDNQLIPPMDFMYEWSVLLPFPVHNLENHPMTVSGISEVLEPYFPITSNHIKK